MARNPATAPGANEKLSLGEEAYLQLYSEIVSCRYKPGERLTEKALAAATGFGSSPIRDALKRLDHEGLVRTIPRKGYQVSPLTPKIIDDLMDVWQIFGPELARLGLRNASPRVKQTLVSQFEEIQSVAGDSLHDVDNAWRVVKLLNDIFALLAETSGNQYLEGAYARIAGDLSRVWVLVISEDPSVVTREAAGFWSNTILGKGDPDAIADSARETIRQAREIIQDIIRAWPSVMNSEIST